MWGCILRAPNGCYQRVGETWHYFCDSKMRIKCRNYRNSSPRSRDFSTGARSHLPNQKSTPAQGPGAFPHGARSHLPNQKSTPAQGPGAFPQGSGPTFPIRSPLQPKAQGLFHRSQVPPSQSEVHSSPRPSDFSTGARSHLLKKIS